MKKNQEIPKFWKNVSKILIVVSFVNKTETEFMNYLKHIQTHAYI